MGVFKLALVHIHLLNYDVIPRNCNKTTYEITASDGASY